MIELSTLEPEKLDKLLALGWFRIQQTIFTTDILYFDGQVYDAVWLRIALADFNPDKKYKELSKRNHRFNIEIKQAEITPQHEALFSWYKQSILFETASSLQSLLFGDATRNVFNTYVINVYDSNELIGTGFFDLGSSAAAGICSIYNPAYKKYSLGKFMIFEKLLYCKKHGFTYFYPGYFVPGYSMFDYKLDIGKPAIEYFNIHNKQWLRLQQSQLYSR